MDGLDNRRDFLKYSGLAGLTGFAGLSVFSQPSIAIAEPVKLPTGLVSGDVTVSSYDVQYSNLDPDSDITVDYILTVDGTLEPESEYHSFSVPITTKNGVVTIPEQSITVPAGEIGFQVRFSHSSLSDSTVTESTNATTVGNVISSEGPSLRYKSDGQSYNDGETVSVLEASVGPDTVTTGGSPVYEADKKNGLGVVNYGDKEYHVSGALSNSTPLTVFMVCQIKYIEDTRLWGCDSPDGDGAPSIATVDYGTDYRLYGTSNSDVSDAVTADWQILSFRIDAENNAVFRKNGNVIRETSHPQRAIEAFTISARSSADTSNPRGDIRLGEFVVYDEAKSDIKMSDIESALNHKWAVF